MFPPPPFGMMPAPPMPPPDFQGLTDEELKAMEGTERKNVEARIKCLRNIQVLLDAAVMEMQQYSQVVARVSAERPQMTPSTSTTTTPAAAATTTTTNSTPEDAPKVEKVEEKAVKKEDLPTEATGAKPKVKKIDDDTNKDKEEMIKKMDDKQQQQEHSEDDELRKRRLAKFEATGNAD